MNTALFYGIVLAIANIVLSLVSYFLGFQTDKIAMEPWFSLLGFAAMIAVLWLGIRAAREETQDKSLAYGKGVLTGFLISVYSGLIGMVYAIIHFTYINPAYADYKIDVSRQKWMQAGFSEAKMAAAEKFTRFLLSPVPLSIVVLITNVVFGVVVALIVAAFLRRAPVGGTPPSLPPESS
jgi:uncharacterized membrane protein YdjX (TVP38/TMEM64 family)